MSMTPRMLITGATGFIGGALASLCLDEGRGDELLFLVRAPHAQDGLQRVRASLARFGADARHMAALREDQILCGAPASAGCAA